MGRDPLIARIPSLAPYGQIEAKSVAAREVRTGLEQLLAKYAEAAREDATTHQYLRDHRPRGGKDRPATALTPFLGRPAGAPIHGHGAQKKPAGGVTAPAGQS